MKDLTSEQIELLETLTEDEKEVFEWILKNHSSDVNEALQIVENDDYILYSDVAEVVDMYAESCGFNSEDFPRWISIDYAAAWYGSFQYSCDFFDEPAGFEGADRFASGEARELYDRMTDWQIKYSRVIEFL